MATKIRLARFGRKKKPFYRIVVADSRSPRDGRHLEKIGFYDPLTNPVTVNLDKERAFYWLGEGAVPSQTVRNILSAEGVLLEWDMRKSGRPEDVIREELQKFTFLREQQFKQVEEAKHAAKAQVAEETKAVLESDKGEAASDDSKRQEKEESAADASTGTEAAPAPEERQQADKPKNDIDTSEDQK